MCYTYMHNLVFELTFHEKFEVIDATVISVKSWVQIASTSLGECH